ncbi:MAG: SgcJ/EcaC family oxidoreductase [Planctomycetaceae bacterium]|nr:SgcJ/EcaC family oxidoreductase [Planctomycetaceae bacterium]
MIRFRCLIAFVLISSHVSIGIGQEAGSSRQDQAREKSSVKRVLPVSERPRFEYLAIEDAIAGYLDAMNQRDAERAASYWSRRGQWTQKNGERVSGRENIAAAIKQSFAEEPPGTTVALNEVSIRLVTPNVAVEEGVAVIKSPESERQTPYSVVHVKMDEGWKIDSVRATRVPVAPEKVSRLESLSWLIGDWRDEVSGGISVETNASWTMGDHSIRRSFQMFDEQGLREQATQVILWDAKLGSIRSWVFDSKGGFGTGVWKQVEENKWAVEMELQMADGGIATARNIYKIMDDSRLEFSSTGRRLNGVTLPDTQPVIVKRK